MSILAIIIEQVSNLDYEQYLKINLFDKNGIKSIGYRYQFKKWILSQLGIKMEYAGVHIRLISIKQEVVHIGT